MRTQKQGHVESEIAFAITQNGPGISRDIARKRSILEYELKPGHVHSINDTYYDTRGGLLRNRKTVLRVRNIDRLKLITLKSNPKAVRGMGVARTEIELPWSRTSLAEMMKRLGLGSAFAVQPRFSQTSPSKVFSNFGLHPVQERQTIRRTRNVFSRERRHERLAELAIDNTTFVFGKTRIKIHEVEIEAKETKSSRPIQRIAKAIALLYPDSIRYWIYGKFVTGLAIQSLFEKNALQKYLVDGELRNGAFRLIERTVQSRSP